MATRTVGDRDEEGKRETEEAAALEQRAALVELMSVQAEELATALMESSGALAARLDGVLRGAVLEAGRLGLERWAEKDRSDCGVANAPRCEHCGGGMRYVGRERSPTETALGGVRLAMGRYACAACGKGARPRSARMDIEGSMTPTARRMASELGSVCCHAEADRLLNLVGGVNFGTKRVERTTRLVGDDLEAGRMDDVLAALRKPGAGAEERDKAIRYLSERRGRMRYDEYRSLGLPIGSGRVEAACKTVVGRRMKCTGMRWTVAGANPVLWVRCARLSGWFDDYWEHRLRKAA